MEGAAAFTTLSGAGLVAIGLSALGAGVLAGAAPGPPWLRVWLVEAGRAARRRRTERPAPAAPALRGVKGEPGPDVARGLDALLHHRLRLGMVSALAAVESLAFNDLKRLLQTSDGNLSVHARKLEDAGYVTCTKTFENRRPRTDYRLTARGRQAVGRYLGHMEAIIRAARDTLGR